MKGLLIKDFFCLKRQLFTFICICVGVLLVSVLVLISSEHGNLANGFQNMIADGDLTAEQVETLMQYCMIFVLLIPMAFTGNVADVFLDDRNASFQKLAGALPISVAKRVASRYITGLSFTMVGFLMDTIIIFVLSGLTEFMAFADFFGAIASFASFMIIYLALFILFEYLLGVDRISIAQILPVILVGAALIIPHIREIGAIFLEENAALNIQAIPEFLMHKSYIPACAAIVILVGSYGISVRIAERKRGVA